MEHKQLELDFGSLEDMLAQTGVVVRLSTYTEARARRLKEIEKAKFLAEIVKSVQHITGRSPDAEMM